MTQLKTCLQKNLKFNSGIHARFLILDDKELICGSADLCSASLSGDHLEAGIWTKDISLVNEAIKLFNKIWNNTK